MSIKEKNKTLEEVIDKIILLKTTKGLTNYQLAINSGVNRNVVGRILKKERSLKAETLFKLIDGLDISLAEFFKSFE